MEHPATGIGPGFDGKDSGGGNGRRPGASTESAGKCKSGSSAQNQPPAYHHTRSASVCDANFYGATIGQRQPHTPGRKLQTRKCNHGASSARDRTDCSAVRANRPGSTFASEHYRRPDAAGRAESSGRRGGDLRSSIADPALPSTGTLTDRVRFFPRSRRKIHRTDEHRATSASMDRGSAKKCCSKSARLVVEDS